MAKTKTNTTEVKAAGALELPKFRYIDDVTRYLSEMRDEINELGQVVKKQIQLLAFLNRPTKEVQAMIVKAAGMTFTIDDDDDKATIRNQKRKIDPKLDKVVVPNVKKLQSQYKVAEALYQKYRALESVVMTLKTQFENRKSDLPYQKAMAEAIALKNIVDNQLRDIFEEIKKIADGHVPKTFKTYMTAVQEEVKRHVNFEDSELMLYVHTADPKEGAKEGNLVFTYYLTLLHVVNDEGKATPHLFISIQWEVSDNGGRVFVDVNHEFELPNKLMKAPGTMVGSAGEAVKAISHLLELEDFSTALGTLPIQPYLKEDLAPELFSFRDHISKINVDNNEMTFVFKRGTDMQVARQAAIQLNQELRSMFRLKKGVKLQMKYDTKQVVFNLASVAAPSQVNTYQAEWIRDQFGLNDSQVRKIVRLINDAADANED